MNMKKDALFKKKFDLVDSAFKLFGFNKSVSDYMHCRYNF